MVSAIFRFNFNEQRFIEFLFRCTLDEIFRFQEVTVTFKDVSDASYLLYTNDFIIDALMDLYNGLKRAVEHNLELDTSIIPNSEKHDIGYLWSIYCHKHCTDDFDHKNIENSINKGLTGENRLIFTGTGEERRWVGLRYHVWSSNEGLCDTWLYNKNGSIFLEVTPSYKWHAIDPKEGEEFFSYSDFMKNYKPYVIAQLDQQNAEEWLKQINCLFDIIKRNDPKYIGCPQERMP